MKRLVLPLIALGLLYLCFFGCLALTRSSLPTQVATHFDGGGRPDGWMSPSGHVRSVIVFGLVFPLFVPALCYLSRFLPAKCYNIPNRDYWLAPERRGRVAGYLFRHSLWFACLAVVFVTGMHLSVLHANRSDPAHLSVLSVLCLAGGFVAGTAIWVVSMVRFFYRAP